MSDVPEKLKPYEFHGLEVTIESKKQAYTDCFICGGEGKMGLIVATGQYRCNKCETTGNTITFLKELHKMSLKATKTKMYNALVKDRNLSAATLHRWGVAQSVITGDWLVPAYNLENKLANLHKCMWSKSDKGEKFRVLGTPGCKLHMFVSGSKDAKIALVSEGPWNPMALDQHIRELGYVPIEGKKVDAKKVRVYGLPGAKNFREEYTSLFEGKDVFLLGDNDYPIKLPTGKKLKPGYEGMLKTVQIIGDSGHDPNSLRMISWGPKGYTKAHPNGYDPRDILTDMPGRTGLKFMLEKCEEVESGSSSSPSSKEEGDEEPKKHVAVEPIECKSYDKLCKHFEGALHFHQTLKDTLAVMLATNLSTPIDETEQIWLRVLGPPGSGKSTLAECLACAREYCFSLDIFTGFNSGFVGGGKANKGKDASLISQVNGKSFIIKDGDTLLTAPNRDRILAELRAIYDKTNRAQYRNFKKTEDHHILTTMIWCGTDELRQLNRSSLGERFLDCDVLGKEDTKHYLQRAGDNAYAATSLGFKAKPKKEKDNEVHSQDKKHMLKAVTYGYMKHLHENRSSIDAPTLKNREKTIIEALCHLAVAVRVKSTREKEEMIHRPKKDVPTRIFGQMIKLGVCLAVVMNRKAIDDEVIRILKKVIFDSLAGFTLEVMQLIASKPEGLSTAQIANELGVAQSTVRRIMEDMYEIKNVRKVEKPNRSGIGGRHLHLWTLSKEMSKLWEIIK